MKTRWLTLPVIFLMCTFAAEDANGGTLTLGMMREYSGGDPPEGATPWITATFDDGGIAGTVDLTLATTNLTGTEFVGEWLFNLDPTLDPMLLSFSTISSVGSFTPPSINTGVDEYKAGGDGLFDLQFEFATSNAGNGRFDSGDSLVVEISGIPTLTAASFDFLSTPKGSSNGPFVTVAHIQAIGTDGEGSGWVTAPEPSSALLSAMGFCLVFCWVWRTRDRREA